jgi:hypothetical protein
VAISDKNSLTDPARFFTAPSLPRQRQYEALRAFFVDERPSAEVARAFGYTPSSFRVLCHHFRHDPRAREFFVPTRFLEFWKKHHGGKLPGELVFDSKLTTHAGLARLDAMEVPFITLRRRDKRMLAEARALPASAWRLVTLDNVSRKFRSPRVFEQTVTVAGCALRQFFIQDLGHEEPTILLTNQRTRSAKQLITRYAQRMLIENSLSDAVRFFHMNALSSAVAMKVDFDLALLVLASGLYRRVAQRMRGYDDAQARMIFRDLIDMPATVKVNPKQVTVTFHRRAHLPLVMASALFAETPAVPWWRGAKLVFQAAQR